MNGRAGQVTQPFHWPAHGPRKGGHQKRWVTWVVWKVLEASMEACHPRMLVSRTVDRGVVVCATNATGPVGQGRPLLPFFSAATQNQLLLAAVLRSLRCGLWPAGPAGLLASVVCSTTCAWCCCCHCIPSCPSAELHSWLRPWLCVVSPTRANACRQSVSQSVSPSLELS